jgi:hypothetical protein
MTDAAIESRVVQEPTDGEAGRPVVDKYSQQPVRTHAGYYVEGGPSPFEIEAQRPVREYLSDLKPGESIDEYLLRRSDDEEAVARLFSDGLARPSDAIPAVTKMKRRNRPERRGLWVLLRRVAWPAR